MKTIVRPVLLVMTFLYVAASAPKTQAVHPPPDGAYANFTTAEGHNALLSLTSGAGNTAVGWYSLSSNSTASFNTGVGAGTLVLNNADANTAVGAAALLLNITGESNTAVGTDALVYNDSGSDNNAVGAFALYNNDAGSFNNAFGRNALNSNVNGSDNTAVGDEALKFNTGNQNTALGSGAGLFQDTGSNNIYIGSGVVGVAGENDTIRIGSVLNSACYIGGIYEQTVNPLSTGVIIDQTGKLGTTFSSQRFKRDIKPMGKASDAIMALKPVTFHYKNDAKNTPCFGLIAEEVAQVNADLVVRDKEGKPYTVRYDQINAMLLNEFLKEHKRAEEQNGKIEDQARKIQEQEATVAELKKEIHVVVAGLKAAESKIEKVSVQIEATKPMPRTAANNR